MMAAVTAAQETDNGRQTVLSLVRAYPGRVISPAIRDGDWSVVVGGRIFFWEDGRLLPADQRANRDRYTAHRFYSYEPGPLQVREVSAELEERLRERNNLADRDERVGYNGFFEALYGIETRADAESVVRSVRFLDRPVRVHPLLVEPLERVEERIRKGAADDVATQRFLSELSQIHGYNWREIAGTARRSYHSYGTAIDLLPHSFNRQFPYWRWAFDAGVEQWWEIPLEQRWAVPDRVIAAFEAEGFVWGGKWLMFDSMHFEYRPEVMLLAWGNRAINS